MKNWQIFEIFFLKIHWRHWFNQRSPVITAGFSDRESNRHRFKRSERRRWLHRWLICETRWRFVRVVFCQNQASSDLEVKKTGMLVFPTNCRTTNFVLRALVKIIFDLDKGERSQICKLAGSGFEKQQKKRQQTLVLDLLLWHTLVPDFVLNLRTDVSHRCFQHLIVLDNLLLTILNGWHEQVRRKLCGHHIHFQNFGFPGQIKTVILAANPDSIHWFFLSTRSLIRPTTELTEVLGQFTLIQLCQASAWVIHIHKHDHRHLRERRTGVYSCFSKKKLQSVQEIAVVVPVLTVMKISSVTDWTVRCIQSTFSCQREDLDWSSPVQTSAAEFPLGMSWWCFVLRTWLHTKSCHWRARTFVPRKTPSRPSKQSTITTTHHRLCPWTHQMKLIWRLLRVVAKCAVQDFAVWNSNGPKAANWQHCGTLADADDVLTMVSRCKIATIFLPNYVPRHTALLLTQVRSR